MGIILKSAAEIEAMKEAGRLSAKALRVAGELCRPGASTWEIDEAVEAVIRDEGGVPAFKGYAGFPASICASVNDEIIHGIPSKDVVLREGDIISIDTGAVVDGWVGDNAWTFPVGEVSEEKRRLLQVGEECLWAGIEGARAGNRMGAIGSAVEHRAREAGCSVVREYVGHGIGRDMHEAPNVPNYGWRHRGVKLAVGMVLAIEPMVNAGSCRTRQMDDGWLVRTEDGRPSVHFEKTVAITEDGPVLLTVEPGRLRPL